MKNAEAAAEFGIWNSAFDIPSSLLGNSSVIRHCSKTSHLLRGNQFC